MSKYIIVLLGVLFFISCDKDPVETIVVAPDTYTFERNGITTVSYSGQTTRILMAEELKQGLKDFNQTEAGLLAMYNNMGINGADIDPFTSGELNNSTKSISSKVASSKDLFNNNTVESQAIKSQIASWISAQINEVFPNNQILASNGIAGQIADGTRTRYINNKGLEYDQVIAKSLIGSMMMDQIINHYISTKVLDQDNNTEYNDNEVTEEAQVYTTMEHYWDEAYGYLFGTSANPIDPLATIGDDDSFLNEYVGSVDQDQDFMGIANSIYEAFKLGRAAIVAKDYTLRDQQAQILKTNISKVIAVKAVYYLQKGKQVLDTNKGSAFHAFSEAYGFIYSLRFTRNATSDQALFTRAEIDTMLSDLLSDGDDGLWNITPATIDQVSEQIAAKFDFTVSQAAN